MHCKCISPQSSTSTHSSVAQPNTLGGIWCNKCTSSQLGLGHIAVYVWFIISYWFGRTVPTCHGDILPVTFVLPVNKVTDFSLHFSPLFLCVRCTVSWPSMRINFTAPPKKPISPCVLHTCAHSYQMCLLRARTNCVWEGLMGVTHWNPLVCVDRLPLMTPRG